MQMSFDLHGLWVRSLSGDHPFFVHQHLSKGVHLLLDLLLCVPERKPRIQC